MTTAVRKSPSPSEAPSETLLRAVVRLPVDLLDLVDQTAAAERTTRAAVLRRLILGAMPPPGGQNPAGV